MKTRLSNWKEESDLYEVVTGKMTDKEALKKVSEKKGINNKVIINPKLSEAVKEIGGELLEVAEIDKEGDKEDPKQAQIASKQKRAQMIKKQVLMKKLMAVRAGSEDIVAHYDPLEAAVEYFYEEGINEEGIDLIIEEVGLDDFVDFVDDSAELLTEERAARKMNVRTLKATQKKAAEIKASKKDVVKRGTPADTVARARAERALKKRKLAKPAAKKEAPKPVAKKDFDGDGKKETPKQEHRGVRNKKITKAVAKVKTTQPTKRVKASKEVVKKGIRAKVKSLYDAGKKRHRKATQPIRVFGKGVRRGVGDTVKFAKKAKKALVGEEIETEEWKPDPVEKRKKKAADLHRRETIASATPAKYKTDKTEDPDKLYRRRMAVDSKTKIRKEEVVLEKDLTAAERRALPNKDFALPGKGEGPKGKQAGSYPIPDEKHARSALSLVSQHGTPEEKAKVRAKVKKKFPGIKVSESFSDWRNELKEGKCECDDCGQDPCIECGESHHGVKEEVGVSSSAAMAKARKEAELRKKEESAVKKVKKVTEAKVDTGSAEAKASARNLRNTPPGKDSKFDTSVFITRKPGESLDSARTRKRREAHAKKRGVKEDKAFDNVVGALRKKYGKDAVLTKDSPKPKPPTEAQKKAAAAERKKRQEADNKAFASRAKKAGYKNPQDYANVVARHGSEDNYKKGKGLGT